MSKIESGQVSASAAEIYEEFYLPALFLEWTPRMADAARVDAGQRVLDVACGTGVLARALVERVGPRGSVVGLALNEGIRRCRYAVQVYADRVGQAQRMTIVTIVETSV
jgi:ubiquinone/menaquinone biosynthesis C-methylase UbiE